MVHVGSMWSCECGQGPVDEHASAVSFCVLPSPLSSRAYATCRRRCNTLLISLFMTTGRTHGTVVNEQLTLDF